MACCQQYHPADTVEQALSEQTILSDSIVKINFCDMPNPVSVRHFKTSPEIIQLAVMLYVRFPLSMRNVEDLLYERGVNVSYESVRYWWQRFGLKKPSKNSQMFTTPHFQQNAMARYPTSDPSLTLSQCRYCRQCRHFGKLFWGNSLENFRICLHCLHSYLSSLTRKGY